MTATNGNAAAMREALEYVLQLDVSDEAAMQDGITDAERIAEYADHIEQCQSKARAALSAPPRNCDVGTVEEQGQRYKDTGEVYHTLTFSNALRWAQMPYTAEGGEG